MKIALGDFNAKVGQEGTFGPTPNGVRLIDFTAAQNMVVCGTRSQHLDFHKVNQTVS